MKVQEFESGILVTPEMEMETQNIIEPEISGILITPEMEMVVQYVIESVPNGDIITAHNTEQSGGEVRYMNFSQALEDLRNGQILKRKLWSGKMIKMTK